LIGNDAAEIEVRFARAIARMDVGVRALEAALEAPGQLVVDLVAARAYRGTQQCANPTGPRPLPHHRTHRRSGYSGQDAAPSSVQGSNHAPLLVGEQHRHAIGGEDAEHDTGYRGDQSVALGTRIVVGARTYRMDRLAVDLLELGEAHSARHQLARALPVDVNRT
jgi:hypothetical protein